MFDYIEEDAKKYIQKYSKWGEDIALRVYTSHLIGRDSNLVLHGGGNTSVKTIAKNILGESISVIAVKGSGWNLDTIEPQGFPMVDLEHCKKLRNLESLSDPDMVNELRTHMLDHKAPTPSVETLLHAFLPHKFVDHSHADDILALVDQPDSSLIIKIFGEENIGIVPYVMPGFLLSKIASEVYENNPKVKGLFLMKHGLFTFGETAKESYENHIHFIKKAKEYLDSLHQLPEVPDSARLYPPPSSIIFPILRGLYHKHSRQHWIINHTNNKEIESFVGSEHVESWTQRGCCTPDHVIRTKSYPLLLTDWPKLTSNQEPNDEDIKLVTSYMDKAIQHYIANYDLYFHTYNDQSNEKKKKLDPLPRVILISKLGLVTIDLSYQASVISRDIYTHSIKIIQNAEKAGRYSPVSPKDLWDMEYWTLEQAKLGTVTRKSLDGNVVYVTGAASGIGRACLDAFASAGASLFIVDLNEGLLDEAIQSIKSKYKSVHIDGQSIDITMPSAVIQSFKHCIKSYGGVDIIISNAGIGYQSQVKDTETMKNSFEINFWSHQYVASTAVDIFLLQNQGSSCSVSLNIGSEDNQHSPSKMGGCLLFNVSKAAVNPGPMFGPYAVAKASTMALMKQYAIDYGADNIRSNAVNADRIRTNFFSQEDLEKRAKARNLPVEEYFKSNLLQQEVTASDVAREFLNMALASKTTTATITVDGGNVAASLR
eukprot:TRINITY_DN3773_c0_g1_i5.p1 TRINITY_DN3773_c0_g1~~TRINITY_DN3773_c0_g1_i5.p1  ORF type:complete len:712 (-),score=167.18 TRINITY_DN3773_c0_g1_i5:91-2226(-)